MRELTIPSYFLESTLRFARIQNKDIRQLLWRAGIAPKLIANNSARYTPKQYANLQRYTMREMNDEMLGYCRRSVAIGTSHALTHWMFHCSTLGQALKRWSLFYKMLEKGFQCEYKKDSQYIYLRIQPWVDDELIDPFGYEMFMFGVHRLASWLVDRLLPVEYACFPYAEPSSVRDYRLMFPHTKLAFNSDICELKLAGELADLPLHQSDESLRAFLAHPLLHIIVNKYNHQDWTSKTQDILKANLVTMPTLEEVADILTIHPKKLRRNLEGEGIGYAELKSQLRRDMAIHLLTKHEDTIERIAYLTGFVETSTFTRAFKRWTGVSPSQYRKLANR